MPNETTITENPTRHHTPSDEAHFGLKREFFDQGNTLPYSFRKASLEKLKSALEKNEDLILHALGRDLNKSETESFLTEIGIVREELNYALKHLKSWMKPRRRFAPILMEPSSSKVYSQPRGVVLIISPWNYPVNLCLVPLIGALAAGCCAVVKPSEKAPHTANLIREILHTCFGKNYVSVINGEGEKIVPKLLAAHRFNHIFFTGSPPVGKIIARTAADHLTSTTLELGGKNPAVIHRSANLKVAARRIAWGKFTNAGQTCVAPDYLLVDAAISQTFIDLLKKAIVDFYGENPKESPDFARMIDTDRFDTVEKYLRDGKIIFGGQTDRRARYIAPTLIMNPAAGSPVMQSEIFGPVLPILIFNDKNEAGSTIEKHPYPLAAYFFGTDKEWIQHFQQEWSFGGGCINDTLLHLGNPALPFGGVMGSGTGHYHGKYSFDCFSHQKSIVHSRTWFDPSLRYPPYSPFKLSWLKKLF